MLASDRGPILEMIVSRMNFVSAKTNRNVRLLGLSSAVANAYDMASWLKVKDDGLLISHLLSDQFLLKCTLMGFLIILDFARL